MNLLEFVFKKYDLKKLDKICNLLAKSVQQLMDPASANKEKGPLGLLICAYSLITTWLGGRNF